MANTEQKPEKELKQVNFRIDPDTANAFREFCTLNGMNQAQGFDHIMQVLELNSSKNGIRRTGSGNRGFRAACKGTALILLKELGIMRQGGNARKGTV